MDSIVKTECKDFEIIAINDGSCDRSEEILKKYSELYPFIRIITQKNSGVSSARNMGIRSSKGEYITFIDSDDYVDSKALNHIIESTLTGNIDFVISGHKRVNDSAIVSIESLENLYCEGDDLRNIFEKGWIGHFQPVWGKFYSRKIIARNNIEFQIGVKMYEDSIFNFTYMRHISNMLISNTVFYAYRKNLGSVTTQFKGMDAVQDIALCFKSQISFFNNITNTIKPKLYKHYAYSMISQIYTIYRDNNLTKKKVWLKKYVNFGNEIVPGWLTYLDKGLPRVIGTFLSNGNYTMASIILYSIFIIERVKLKLI